MFKRIASFHVQAVLKDEKSFSDWRELVKKANGVGKTTKAFLEPGIFTYDPKRFIYFTSRSISGDVPNRNGDFFPWKELVASYETFIGKGVYVEHLENDITDAKGLVLDAVCHEEEKYIETLNCVDRILYPEIAGQIEGGIINSTSMSCFTPGTPILMGDYREKPIEQIVVGDEVITHKGNKKKVVQLFQNPHNGKVLEIKTSGVNKQKKANNYLVTLNHPFLVAKPKMYINKDKFHPQDSIQNIYKKETNYKIELMKKESIFNFKWVKAENLKVEDLVVMPFLSTKNNCEINSNKARLIGWFLAEGSFRKDNKEKTPTAIKFTLNINEIEFIQEILSLMKKEFGVKGYTCPRPKINTVYVSSGKCPKEMVEFFLKYCGQYSHLKKLPGESLLWPTEIQKEIISTFFNGDGCQHKINNKRGGSLSIGTTSRTLANQLFYMSARCGMHPRFKELGEKYTITNGRQIHHKEHHKVFWPRYDSEKLGNTKIITIPVKQVGTKVMVFKDCIISPISKITEHIYEGSVYNFEVEDDHSYIANKVAVHNCNCESAECSECGTIAHNFSELCLHCKAFEDEEGKIANVNYCKGRLSPSGKTASVYETNRGITFTGNSAVAIPADPTAQILEVFASLKTELDKHLFDYKVAKMDKKNREIVIKALQKLSKAEIKILADAAKEVEEAGAADSKNVKEEAKDIKKTVEEGPKLQTMIDDAGQKVADNVMKSAIKEVIEEKAERMVEPQKLMLEKVVAPKIEDKLNQVVPQIEQAVKDLAGTPVNASINKEAGTAYKDMTEIEKKHVEKTKLALLADKDFKAQEGKTREESAWAIAVSQAQKKEASLNKEADIEDSMVPAIPAQEAVSPVLNVILPEDKEIKEVALGDGWILKETNIDNKIMMEVFDRDETTGEYVEMLPEELSETEKVSKYREILDIDSDTKENIKEEVKKMSNLTFKYITVAGADAADSLERSFFVVKAADKKMKIVRAKYLLSQEQGDNIVSGKEIMEPEEFCKKLAEQYTDYDAFIKHANLQKEEFKKIAAVEVNPIEVKAKEGKSRFSQFSFNEKEIVKEKLIEAGDKPVVSVDGKEAAEGKKGSEATTSRGNGAAVKKLYNRLPSNSQVGGEPAVAIDRKSTLGQHARILRQAVEKQRQLEASIKEKDTKIALLAKEVEEQKKEKEVDLKSEIISEITSGLKESEAKGEIKEQLMELDEASLKALKSVLDLMNEKEEDGKPKKEELNAEAGLLVDMDQIPAIDLVEEAPAKDGLNSVEDFAQAWGADTLRRMQQ